MERFVAIYLGSATVLAQWRPMTGRGRSRRRQVWTHIGPSLHALYVSTVPVSNPPIASWS